tara:strand:+ start:215893 stop:216669 length:777 start_codon:yes stop_codon:yes gene_type:complete
LQLLFWAFLLFLLPTLAGAFFPLITALDQLYFEGSGELEASFDAIIYNLYVSVETIILVMAVDWAEQNKTLSFRKIWRKLWINSKSLTLVVIFILCAMQVVGYVIVELELTQKLFNPEAYNEAADPIIRYLIWPVLLCLFSIFLITISKGYTQYRYFLPDISQAIGTLLQKKHIGCLVIFYLMYVVCIDHKDFIEWFFIERNAVYGGEVIVLGPDDTLDEPIPISMLKELSYQASFLITQVIYLAALYYPLRGEQHTA